jgi:hypothetical protein
MSRSHRKTPVTGITTSESDTRDKVLVHRRQRRGGGNHAPQGRRCLERCQGRHVAV